MAAGVVLSVRRRGSAELSSGSQRSSRVTRSPIERLKRVTARGPPSSRSSRLAAVLSLSQTAASQSRSMVSPLARHSGVSVIRESGTQSSFV